MKAVILAAGKGVRMLPLTNDKPKVMIEVNGRPFLHYVIENLKNAGIKEIGIVVGYRSDKVKQYFGEKFKYIEQKEQLGTAHAVLQARDFVGADDFLVIMGDNLYSSNDILDISKKEEFYVSAFRSDTPSAYGVLETQSDMLVGISEKPAHPKSNLVNTGLYKMTPEIFEEITKLRKSPRGEYELTDALSNLARHGKVRVYKLKDYWIDMSFKEQLPEIEDKLKKLKL